MKNNLLKKIQKITIKISLATVLATATANIVGYSVSANYFKNHKRNENIKLVEDTFNCYEKNTLGKIVNFGGMIASKKYLNGDYNYQEPINPIRF